MTRNFLTSSKIVCDRGAKIYCLLLLSCGFLLLCSYYGVLYLFTFLLICQAQSAVELSNVTNFKVRNFNMKNKTKNTLSLNINKMTKDTILDQDSEDDQEEQEENLKDENTCGDVELEQIFNVKYHIADESAVTLKKDYILSLALDNNQNRIATGLSNGAVQIFDINSQQSLMHSTCISAPDSCTKNPNDSISTCGVRFLDANCLFVGTTNHVKLYDLRTSCVDEIARFECTDEHLENTNILSTNAPKVITCFDCNSNGRVLCTGTEEFKTNVFLLFYDVRERKFLGGYYESHQDDITTLRFHRENPDLLCTGSTDGLVNVFNIKETTEDDALMNTMNTESSVHKLNWHKNVYDKDIISCITHTNDFKAYECEEGDLIVEFERSEIAESMKRKNPANLNVINSHNTTDGGVFLLAGTNQNKGEILRSLHLQNKKLLPLTNFDGNKQILRDSIYDEKSNILLTAGESGIVTLWKSSSDLEKYKVITGATAQKMKTKTKIKSAKKTPY